MAARIRSAAKGERRRAALLRMIATIGQRVEPRPPAVGSWAYDRWLEARRAELHRQIDLIAVFRPRP
jgi:hypothetical protein